MKRDRQVLALPLAIAALCASSAFADPARAPLDQETTVGDVGVGCTGIGQTKDDPKWAAYPVKLEFADAQHALLANETVKVSGPKGDVLAEVRCEGPWLLLKLPAGKRYQVEARLAEQEAAPQTANVRAPAHGQATFVLTFPDAH